MRMRTHTHKHPIHKLKDRATHKHKHTDAEADQPPRLGHTQTYRETEVCLTCAGGGVDVCGSAIEAATTLAGESTFLAGPAVGRTQCAGHGARRHLEVAHRTRCGGTR